MKQVAIYGVSGCGRGVMPLARQQWAASGERCELVFVDDDPPAREVNGHRVLTYSDWLTLPASSRHISVAVASPAVRRRLTERCEADRVGFFEVRASNVVQLDDVHLAEGAILCPFVTLTSNIRIGRHFHANLYSYVEHDCIIRDYVTFAPGVKCNGNITIEDFAYIGSGAVIKNGRPGRPIVIGRGAVVGMGAVVTRSVPPGTTVVGNPAKPLLKGVQAEC